LAADELVVFDDGTFSLTEGSHLTQQKPSGGAASCSEHPVSSIAAPSLRRSGPDFYDVVTPAIFPQHRLRLPQPPLGGGVSLDALDDAESERHFAVFAPLPENLPQPLALRYHGH
jgi:uncharacterized protein YdiU (UPF0061 family)